MGRRWPDHCCCCGLRPGGYVIGGIAIVICLPLMAFVAKHGFTLNDKNTDDVKDSFYMTVSLYRVTAVLNAIELVFTIGLFWGIYKRKERWVTRWLFVSAGWWTHHAVFSMALLLSASHYVPLLCASFIAPFIYFLGYRAMKTVAGLRDEMVKEGDVENQLLPYPASDSAVGASADAERDANASSAANASAGANADDNVQL